MCWQLNAPQDSVCWLVGSSQPFPVPQLCTEVKSSHYCLCRLPTLSASTPWHSACLQTRCCVFVKETGQEVPGWLQNIGARSSAYGSKNKRSGGNRFGGRDFRQCKNTCRIVVLQTACMYHNARDRDSAECLLPFNLFWTLPKVLLSVHTNTVVQHCFACYLLVSCSSAC